MRDASAIHFDERDDADAFVEMLAERRLTAHLHREEFAGEDDAEDAAWIVEVAGEVGDLAALAEKAGGWLIDAGPTAIRPAPPLPQAPKRLKRGSSPRPAGR